MTKILINSEFITLGQFLKKIGVISTGGAAKYYLQDNVVIVNELAENRRGRKLFNDDIIIVSGVDYVISVLL